MQSVKRLAILLLVASAAVALARRRTLRETWVIVVLVTGAFLVVGIVAELVLGQFHPFTPGYRFAGTLHPNDQGVNLSLLFMGAAYVSLTSTGRAKALYTLIGFTALAFLIMTKSRNALFSLFIAASCFLFLAAWSRSRVIGVCVALGFLSLAIIVVMSNAAENFLPTLVAMGRLRSDPTGLTGRVQLWTSVLLPYLAARLWTGYGYGAFWSPEHIWTISGVSGWSVMDAHSVYVQIALNLGLVGLVLFLLLLLSALYKSLRITASSGSLDTMMLSVLLVYCLAHGTLEVSVWSGGFLTFLLLTAIARIVFAQRLALERQPLHPLRETVSVPPIALHESSRRRADADHWCRCFSL